MRLVIPISASDTAKERNPKLLEDFLAALAFYGGLDQHHILIVPTLSQEPVSREVAQELGRLCPHVKVVPLNREPRDPWPIASNNHFAEAAFIWAQEEDVLPTLWMELDTFPCQSGWLNTIAAAMLNSKMPYMGCVRETEYYNSEGYREHYPGETVMMGVAVYPHDMDIIKTSPNPQGKFYNRVPFELATLRLPGNPNLDPNTRAISEPWDYCLRHSILGDGRQATNLIGDQWNTYNYRVENGVLTCDPLPSPPHCPLGRPRGGAINPNNVIVHGCKDSSGHRLAASGQIPRMTYTPSAPAERLIGSISQGQNGSSLQDILAMMAEMNRQSEERMAKMVQAIIGAQAPRTTDPEVPYKPNPSARELAMAQQQKDLQDIPTSSFTEVNGDYSVGAILKFLDGRRKTMKQIAEGTSIPVETVRTIIISNPEVIEIENGNAGWVKPVVKTVAQQLEEL